MIATVYWYRADSVLSKITRAVTRSAYSHVAIMTNGCLFEALGRGLIVRSGVEADLRAGEAVAFKTLYFNAPSYANMLRWLQRVTEETNNNNYSWLGLLAAGLGATTRRRFRLGVAGEYICSGLVATALWRGGVDFPLHCEPTIMTPEDLAEFLRPSATGRAHP